MGDTQQGYLPNPVSAPVRYWEVYFIARYVNGKLMRGHTHWVSWSWILWNYFAKNRWSCSGELLHGGLSLREDEYWGFSKEPLLMVFWDLVLRLPRSRSINWCHYILCKLKSIPFNFNLLFKGSFCSVTPGKLPGVYTFINYIFIIQFQRLSLARRFLLNRFKSDEMLLNHIY